MISEVQINLMSIKLDEKDEETVNLLSIFNYLLKSWKKNFFLIIKLEWRK